MNSSYKLQWTWALLVHLCYNFASGAILPDWSQFLLPQSKSNSPTEDSPASGQNAVSSSSSLLSPALAPTRPNLFALSCACLV